MYFFTKYYKSVVMLYCHCAWSLILELGHMHYKKFKKKKKKKSFDIPDADELGTTTVVNGTLNCSDVAPYLIIINAFLMRRLPLWLCTCEAQSAIHETLQQYTWQPNLITHYISWREKSKPETTDTSHVRRELVIIVQNDADQSISACHYFQFSVVKQGRQWPSNRTEEK